MTGYLTPKKAAEYLAIHYRTFVALVRSEGLKPAIRVGSRNRYTAQQLDAFGETMRRRAEQARSWRHRRSA